MFALFSLIEGTNGVHSNLLMSFAFHLKGRVNYFLMFSGRLIKGRIFFQRNHIGQSYIEFSESSIKSATISE